MVDYLEQLGIREQSPLVSLEKDEFQARGLKVYVKQEYLLHPIYGGNKWRKLKYNLKHYLEGDYESLWTFGGAFSNHIYAVSAVAKALDIPCHGIIRDTLANGISSPTLDFAKSQGMQLHFVSRQAYRHKKKILEDVASAYNGKYIIPEGGSNTQALIGVGEIIDEINTQLAQKPDYWVCSAGSGGMAAGLLTQLNRDQRLLVFPALKGDWMYKTILDLLPDKSTAETLQIIDNYHFGGFAKYNLDLIEFMKDWHGQIGFPLDPIYNGKSFFGFCELVKQEYFPTGSTIVLIHSGGLQGIPAFNKRNALQLPTG